MGSPTSSPVASIANCTPRCPDLATSHSAMERAAPLSPTSLPSIAPNTRISATLPIVALIPFRMDCRMLSASMPFRNPTTNAVTIRARNASSFITRTSARSTAIAMKTEKSGIAPEWRKETWDASSDDVNS